MLYFYGHSSAAIPAPRVCFTSVWFSFSPSPQAQSLLHTSPLSSLSLSTSSRLTWSVCCPLPETAAWAPSLPLCRLSARVSKRPLLFPTHKQRGGHRRRGGEGACMPFFFSSIFLVGEERNEKGRVLLHIELDQEALVLCFNVQLHFVRIS